MWACHLIFTVFNSTIMLNLLISLMGDSFNRVNENTAIADAIELIHMVLEAETLLF